MDAKNSPEQQAVSESTPKQNTLIVSQPGKLEDILGNINAMTEVGEKVSEKKDNDLGGSSTGAPVIQGDDDQQMTARDIAIANLPSQQVMQQKITEHITNEIKMLQKKVRKSAGKATKAGNAYKLNQVYARMRQLNRLLSHILESSYEVVKRLFIRIFIDKQTVI